MKKTRRDQKTVFITGVAGFLGRHIAQYFKGQGWCVVGIDILPPENAPMLVLAAYYSCRLPDVTLGNALRNHAPDLCIHCAGRASVPLSVVDPAADFYANVVVTFEVLEALRNHAPDCKFIFLSSAAVYGNPSLLPVTEEEKTVPISPYGTHKLQAELMCSEYSRVYGLPSASLRLFSAYGPGLRRQVMWDIVTKALSGNSCLLQGTGGESRDFIHALDIAQAVHVVASSAPMSGEIYNLASGCQVTISELANMIVKALSAESTIRFDGVIPPGTPRNWCADISKIMALGFAPTVTLERGIAQYVAWCRAELENV